jgi:hypothetical protein
MCGIDYKPENKCPRFIDELLKPCLTDDDIDLLQRYLGPFSWATTPPSVC